MKLKLFKKYFLATSAIIILSLSIMMMILSFVFSSYVTKSKQHTLNLACEEVADYLNQVVDGSKEIDTPRFFGIMRSIAKIADIDLFITDTNGEIVACGCAEPQKDEDCIHTGISLSKEELKRYSNTGKELKLGTLGIYSKTRYISSKAVKNKDNTQYATVFATAPLTSFANLISTITKLYLAWAIVPLILMFFAISVMTYRMTKPLKLMSEAARAMAKGDFSRRIPVTSDDEIGELAISFNMMTNSLSQLESMRKDFVANVSHELKTPMTTISGFIDGILDGTIEPTKQHYYLEIVSDEIKRLSRLVQSMLSMARLESGEFTLKPELFDFRELLCTIVISQEQRIENRRLKITGLDTLESISLKADRDLIHQVIYNLVDNAIKFSNPGGEISFTLHKENKKLVFTVSNTGPGIPQKDLMYIFERFYKVDKSRSEAKNNTGLGLYLVKTIVVAHSG
ncbi:MAG: HAMP domain-containing sensor histidine kinase, partial [Acutalibacteraceae bacterium]